MRFEQDCVKFFLEHFGFMTRPAKITELPKDQPLIALGTVLIELSEKIDINVEDPRATRVRKFLEEVGETIFALGNAESEAEVLDGLSDVAYTMFGIAATFDLPLASGFAEVHTSNMTKTRSDALMAEKGPNYVPPNFEQALQQVVQNRTDAAYLLNKKLIEARHDLDRRSRPSRQDNSSQPAVQSPNASG